jgi:hypothetical protein
MPEDVIYDMWNEYSRLYAAGEVGSAFTRLGEIANYLEHAHLPERLTRKWYAALQDVPTTDDDIRIATAQAERRIERLQRLVSVGTKFLYEEVMLAITYRIELEMLGHFLEVRGIHGRLDTASIDENLLGLARSHGELFRKVQAVARRNWGIPLKSRWLEQS